MELAIQIYACPTEGCGNYYGSSTMPDLAHERTGVRVEDRASYIEKHGGDGTKHTRANCPDCRARGSDVERVLKTVTVTF